MTKHIATAVAFAMLAVTAISTTGAATAAPATRTAAIKATQFKAFKFNRRLIAAQIRHQAKLKGLRLTRRQVHTAVNQAIGGFKPNGPGVQKIYIRILTKRVDVCFATGKHVGKC